MAKDHGIPTLVIGAALAMLSLIGAQPVSAQDECSYCVAPNSCIVEDGSGPGNSTCWVLGHPPECHEDQNSCRIMQTFVPGLEPDDQLEIVDAIYGPVVLARVDELTFAAWSTCDGKPEIMARRTANGHVIVVEASSAPDTPTYQQWKALRDDAALGSSPD